MSKDFVKELLLKVGIVIFLGFMVYSFIGLIVGFEEFDQLPIIKNQDILVANLGKEWMVASGVIIILAIIAFIAMVFYGRDDKEAFYKIGAIGVALVIIAAFVSKNGINKVAYTVNSDTGNCQCKGFSVKNGLFSSTKQYNWNDIVSADVFISVEEDGSKGNSMEKTINYRLLLNDNNVLPFREKFYQVNLFISDLLANNIKINVVNKGYPSQESEISNRIRVYNYTKQYKY